MKWWKYEAGRWEAFTSISEMIPRKTEKIFSVVGAGGKTTLIYRYAQELKEQGLRVIVTTTTHMEKPKEWFCEWQERSGREELCELLQKYGIATVGCSCNDGKITGIPKEDYPLLLASGDVVLVEADGSAKHPVKVPANHEPVIFPGTEYVIGIVSAGSIGKEIEEAGHRPSDLAAFLGKKRTEKITAADLVKISESGDGLLKNVKVPCTIVWTNVNIPLTSR